MKYEDIKDFNQRCEEHPGHQTGMVSYQMIQQRLSEEIDELRAYIEQRTWIELNLTEVKQAYDLHAKYQIEDMGVSGWVDFADAIQTILKSKNT